MGRWKNFRSVVEDAEETLLKFQFRSTIKVLDQDGIHDGYRDILLRNAEELREIVIVVNRVVVDPVGKS